MSRVGKQPIKIPSGVSVRISGSSVAVKGPLGELQMTLPPGFRAEQKDDMVLVSADPGVTDRQGGSAMYGMARARLANLVGGVHSGFKKELEIHGLGQRAKSVSPQKLDLSLGFSHPVVFEAPKGIKLEVDKKSTRVVVSGIDKDLVGQTAARLRSLRPPEPYKGAGIRYAGERIVRKAGKAAAGAGGGAKK
ncbi:50S ribosomal protein L6 [Elusimicrobiota bacterium]